MKALYNEVFKDESSLNRNLITLNLFPQRIGGQSIELLRTKLQLQLSIRLWSKQKMYISATDLSYYIQSLTASCIDPRNFYGLDLVHQLNESLWKENATIEGYDRYFALFTMCLVSKNSDEFEKSVGSFNINQLLDTKKVINDESIRNNKHEIAQLNHPSKLCSSKEEMKGTFMQTIALSCYSKLEPRKVKVEKDLNDIMARILRTQNIDDGSFGGQDVITTSLAVQSAIESDVGKLFFLWNRKKAINFINKYIINATADEIYYIIPAFHETWSKIRCKNKKYIKD